MIINSLIGNNKTRRSCIKYIDLGVFLCYSTCYLLNQITKERYFSVLGNTKDQLVDNIFKASFNLVIELS